MAVRFEYGVAEVNATGGAGNLTLSGTAATLVHRTWAAACQDGEQYRYSILDLTGGQYEFGLGTWNAGTTELVRNTIDVSSNSNNPIVVPQTAIIAVTGSSPAKMEELETLSVDYSPVGHSHNTFSSGAAGFVPAPGVSTGRLLQDDATWVTPSSGGIPEPANDGNTYARQFNVWNLTWTRTEAAGQFDSLGSAAAVQSNLDDHVGAGGATEHPLSTTGDPGFLRALNNESAQFMNGTGNWAKPDHADLDGLTTGDPHTQYLNNARGDARYAQLSHVGAIGTSEHGLATTGDAGFLRALSNTATQYLDGTGNWSTPPTGGSPTLVPGDMIYRGVSVDVALGIGTPGQVLKVNGTGNAPEWQTDSGGGVTNPPSEVGDLWTFHSGNTQRLAVGVTNGHVLTVNSGVTAGIEWAPAPGGSVNNPPDTKGDLWTFHSGDTQKVPVGATDGHVLTVNAATTAGFEWAAPSGSGGDVTGPATNADNVLAVWNGVNSKALDDQEQILVTNVARRDVANALTGNQSVSDGDLQQALTGSGTTNKRAFGWKVETGDEYRLQALNDSLAFVRDLIRVNHDGNFTNIQTELQESGAQVTYATEVVWGATTETPMFDPGQTHHVRITGNTTVNNYSGGRGIRGGIVEANANPAINGSITVLGSRDITKAAAFSMVRTGNGNYWIWGAEDES